MTDTEQQLADALHAIAGPGPDVDAAWAAVQGRATTRRPPRRWPIAVLVGAAAAVLLLAVVLAQRDGDDDSVVVVPPDPTSSTASTSTSSTSTSTTLPPIEPSSTEATLPIPVTPLVVSRDDSLELWDGDTEEIVGVLTTAGHGRTEQMAEGYRISEVSLGGGVVAFTELAGPEDQPSIWRLDLATGVRDQVVTLGRYPAVSPDGTRLAYVRGEARGGVAQEIGILELTTGSERVIGPWDGGSEFDAPTSLASMEWSPDGTRLLVEDRYENYFVVVLDPDTAERISDGVTLDGEHRAPSWIDDAQILSGWSCCYPGDSEDQRQFHYAVSDADTGIALPPIPQLPGEADATAVSPGGDYAVKLVDVAVSPALGTLHLPGGTVIEDVRDFDW